MKLIYLGFQINLFSIVTQCADRHRRQYNGYGYAQQYGSQYGLYGPGGQGWSNNNNNGYPNQQGLGWNSNFNWNQGNQRPEWYYNTSATNQSSILCFILLLMYILLV